MDLLRSVATHEVHIGGRSYEVRPPSVREALTILSSAIQLSATMVAEDEDEGAFVELREAARQWLPPRLYRTLFPPRWCFWKQMDAATAVSTVTRIASIGTPDEQEEEKPKRRGPEPKKLTPEAAARRFLRTDWALQVAEVAHAFHLSPDAVLSTPWPLFLLLVQKADAMRARAQMDLISAKSLPYTESKSERDKAFAALTRRAGYHEEKSREERLEEQRALFEGLKRRMAIS